jgi:4-amino-4-deoxy-L-arabinose transferase-like glycosyltransferase
VNQIGENGEAGLGRPALWTIALLCLGWVYLFGIASNPARWEEPRRCLVAMEMIASGDYVVPTVMGEIYLKKPPLYNWLIVLASGNRFEAADVVRARGVTLAALLLVSLLVYRLGPVRAPVRPHPLPALIFLTMAVVVQLGRAGEIDIVFTLCTTAALASFELGRRRGSPALQWFVPQLCVAAGVLTKGIAPLFFYPPVIYCAWRFRERIRFAPLPFLLGLLAMAAAIAAWLVPYSRSVPVSELEGSGFRELLWVFRKEGLGGTLLHPLKYPLIAIGAAMPWTIYPLVMGRQFLRELREGMRTDPYAALAVSTVAWGLMLYLFVPGVAPRYLIPLLPFVAVWVAGAMLRGGAAARDTEPLGPGERRLRALSRSAYFWLAGVVILVGYALGGGAQVLGDPRIKAALAFGLPMIALFAYLVLRRGLVSSVIPLLLLGLIYGVGFSGVWEARRASRTSPYLESARELAAAVDETSPVVCDCPGGPGRMIGYQLSQALGRPVRRQPPDDGPFFLVTTTEGPGAPTEAPAVESWRYGLWRVDPRPSLAPPRAEASAPRAAAPRGRRTCRS